MTWVHQTSKLNNDSLSDPNEDPLEQISVERASQETNNDLTDAFSKLHISQTHSFAKQNQEARLNTNTRSNSIPNLIQLASRRQTIDYFQTNGQKENEKY